MKKFIYCSLLCVLIASCSDKLDEKHEDPDAFTSTKIEYLFAQGAQKTIENNYGDMYTYLFRRFGIYLQVTARQEGQDKTNLYQNVTSDLGRWQDYYETRMGPLTEIDKIYNTLSEADRTYYNNFYYAGKVLQAYNTILTTDFFGDMRSNRRCFPNILPTQNAPVSLSQMRMKMASKTPSSYSMLSSDNGNATYT